MIQAKKEFSERNKWASIKRMP